LLYLAVKEVVEDRLAKNSTHPPGVDRYAFAYKYLRTRANAPRTTFASGV
jgi:hypothetical protein